MKQNLGQLDSTLRNINQPMAWVLLVAFTSSLAFVGCGGASEIIYVPDNAPAPTIDAPLPSVTALLNGSEAQAESDFDLGDSPIGEDASFPLIISNNGTANLSIRLDEIPNGLKIDEEFPIRILPGEAKQILVRLGSLQITDIDGKLVLSTNDASHPKFSMRLRLRIRERIQLISSRDGTPAGAELDVISPNALSSTLRSSADGRFVMFTSTSTKLLPGNSAAKSQIFIRDTVKNELIIASTSERDGLVATTDCTLGEITANGSDIIFSTSSKNLRNDNSAWSSPAAANSTQVYIKTLASNGVRLVSSKDGTNAKAGNSTSNFSEISDDGKFAYFLSTASNLIDGISGFHIYRKNLQDEKLDLVTSIDGSGAAQTRVTLYMLGNPVDRSFQVSANGKWAVFRAYEGSDPEHPERVSSPGTRSSIYRRDIVNGGFSIVNAWRENGALRVAANESRSPMISDDGRYIGFASNSQNLEGGSSKYQVYLKDMLTDSIRLVSGLNSTTPGNEDSFLLSITPNGRYVLFSTSSNNLVAWDQAGSQPLQIYRKDLVTGQLLLVSSPNNLSDLASSGAAKYSGYLSADGRRVDFIASNTSFFPGTALNYQIYRRNFLP